MKHILILALLFCSLFIHAQDIYITTADLNLRSGAGKNYTSITVIEKGETVKLIDTSGKYWVKIQYDDKIGYSAKKYIQKTEISEVTQTFEEEVETKTESGNGFIVFLLFFSIVTVIAIILKNTGEKHRFKSTATLLSFFFGTLGFQKFYLGEKNKGIFSILFCWSFIPTVIGLYDFIKLTQMDDGKFDSLFNGMKSSKNTSTKPTNITKPRTNSIPNVSIHQSNYSFQSKQKYVNNTIIDVNSEKFDVTIDEDLESNKSIIDPPYWGHIYVYSYEEINHATQNQKKYYHHFKDMVNNGKLVDLQNNTNYAFILYFDFLNEYNDHRDINFLYKQLKLLGEICPKTRSYSFKFLQNELNEKSISYPSIKLNEFQVPTHSFQYGYSDYNPDLYKLGTQYKDKLGLTEKEISWLNKFQNPSNVFTSIEGCCKGVIKVYLDVFNELHNQLSINGTNIEVESDKIFEKVVEMESLTFGKYSEEYEKRCAKDRFQGNFFITFYKTIENLTREKYGHKRKLSFEKYHPYSKSITYIDETIGNLIQNLIIEKIRELIEPDLETQIALNTQNVNRWKIEFDDLTRNFKKEELNKFVASIIALEKTNQNNPNIEDILIEASKFIAKYDKVQSLKYYATYIYYDLKSKTFDNKTLTKTMQRSLFKTDEQIKEFREIIVRLIKTKDLQTALENISNIYVPKRKKINLDRYEIEKVEKRHEGTVELLNGYLVDNIDKTKTEIEDNLVEDIEIEIITTEKNKSIFISEISMKLVQEKLVEMIVNNSYEIPQYQVDKYAIENGMFKNQLIDSINEACEEHLDGEALIEEDENNYIIEESYYKEITK